MKLFDHRKTTSKWVKERKWISRSESNPRNIQVRKIALKFFALLIGRKCHALETCVYVVLYCLPNVFW